MLNWIRELALPPLPGLLPQGPGGATSAPLAVARQTPGWLALAMAQLQPFTVGPGPVTLFAPTDAALLQAGVSPHHLPAAAFQQWLMRHLTLLDSPTATVVRMLDGSLLRRDAGKGWRDASGERVGELGGEAGAGSLRLQWVDRPLQPASASLWQQIAAEPGLGRFAEALQRTGLAPLLGCSGPFTVFAPSDAGLDRAAARLGLRQRALWADPARLGRVLRQHVVPGRWSSLDLPWGGQLRSWAEKPLRLTPLGQVLAGGCIVQALADGSDQPCSNGVLHRLHDALLAPD
jgi:uncharacterized surface protein with fasciclin (FAS1) repeats